MPSRITLGRRDLFSLCRHDIFPVIEQTQVDSPTSQDDTASSSDKPIPSSETSSHVPIVAITREDMPPAFRPFFRRTDDILLKSPSQTQTKNWASEYQKFRRSTKTTPSFQAIDMDMISRQLLERYRFVPWPQRIARTFGWMAFFYLTCFVAPNLLAGRSLAETQRHQANVPVMVMVLLIFLVLELDTLMTKWMDKQNGMYGQGRWGLSSLRHMYRALKSFYAIYKEI
ncbi:hypothetical protein V8F06_004469 [Rhypophila decipiens]